MPISTGVPASPSAMDLGLNPGGALQDQLKDETDEQRKKRLMLQQQRLALGPAAQSLGLGGYNG